jgi:excisionase family DNA binding protein
MVFKKQIDAHALGAAKRIYTTREVGRLLHVHWRSVINWIEQGLLVSYSTPGGHRRIRRDDLLVFLRKHHIPTSLLDESFSVLIVDDDEEITGALRSYFQQQGSYEVFTASDGLTALIEFGRITPDLLIIDVWISDVDRIEVCRRIKALSASNTAIIAISGVEVTDPKALDTFADAFIGKPVDIDKLHTEARRLLGIW